MHNVQRSLSSLQVRDSTMEKMVTLVSCLLLVVGVVSAQTVPTTSSERLLPQWATGIIAVAGFLFLCFFVLLLKKAWFEDPSRKRNSADRMKETEFALSSNSKIDVDRRDSATVYATTLDFRSNGRNAYDNLAIDMAEEKITNM
ncbi:PDZK1-interacting protein 1 [Stegastes partitus]|uniref:PDZK1-interacting protein 1 n=1 Tax=Stegastes partitus TaxID=144197 RepID=A0A9Y4N3R1_9TELE|nr:PREDICTED: small integral membrane protein 24 [Stegastes partitus]